MMRRAWYAPFAYVFALAFAACAFPEVTIVDDPECLDDSQCTDGLRCSADATCVPCVSSNHCANGMVCAPNGSCVQCNGAGDCGEAEVCDVALQVCVGCLDEGDCSAGDVCAGGSCGPPHCANMTRDEDEIGVDCGGSCAGCDLGAPCMAPQDCQSEVCENGQCSLPCVIKANCEALAGTYCDVGEGGEGTCKLEKAQGAECVGDEECQTGHCSRDGACCNEACDQACFACRELSTGLETGECGGYLEDNYEDPDCPDLQPYCNDDRECVTLPI